MPAKLIITGGRPLSGEVLVRGSKNTALPLIAACLLTAEPCRLENVPDISDVATMAAIAEGLGAEVAWDRLDHRLEIRARHLAAAAPDEALSRRLRGSILFAGALLGRMREVGLPAPGGDAIGGRPITTHLRALEGLGAEVRDEGRIKLDGRRLAGADVTLEEPSVTATENAVLAAAMAPGRSILRLAAFEPHVQELVAFLRAMGADIRFTDFHRIEISGVERLGGAAHVLNPDELEISSFATLAAATRSAVTLAGVDPRYLDAVLLQLKTMGVNFALDPDRRALGIRPPAGEYRSFRVQSGIYPKLGSDHLPPFAVLATQARGISLIHDWIYEGRLRYLAELQKMGADCRILDPHRALITGPTPLRGAEIAGLDIRAGMTMIIAALAAQGRSVIADAEHIDRGYERIEERLQALGADIQRLND